MDNTTNRNIQTATFAAGCFWCTEAQFQQLNGVISVESGYMGGHLKNPTYVDVCTGLTGHAEVCNIKFDANIISFEEMLLAFMQAHDPTQLNRQGNDIGTQYRSAIFYHNEEQKAIAQNLIDTLNRDNVYDKPVVTTLEPLSKFYKAEGYHQNYYNANKYEPYCVMVVKPKLEKFKKLYSNSLKQS